MGILTIASRTISRNSHRIIAAVTVLILIRWIYFSSPEEARQGYDLKYNVPHPVFPKYETAQRPSHNGPVAPKDKFVGKVPEKVLDITADVAVHEHAEATAEEKEKSEEASVEKTKKPERIKEFVVASLVGDEVSWFEEYFPDWKTNMFVMNDPNAKLTVKKNKGREATAYLTFMIDNYDDLPDYMVFLHALRYQWHNEDPMYDGVPMLQKLRLERVKEEGYLNIRCTWTIGCPGEIKPMVPQDVRPDDSERSKSEAAYAEAFQELFPNMTLPTQVGVGCGAQFALTRDKVRERPKEDYIRYRQWLWDTPLQDSVSGRILEYSWHMMFGKGPVHCPTAKECFCKSYGLCDLNCPEDGMCEKRFQLPKFATIPENWPKEGPGRDGWPAKDWWKDDT